MILDYRLKTVKMVSLMLYIFYDFKCMARISFKAIRKYFGDFPGGQVAKTPHAPIVGGLGLIPRQGTTPHMQQLGVSIQQLKIQHVSTKTRHSLTNKYKIK